MKIKAHNSTFAIGGVGAKFNGSSSIELLCKTEHLCSDFRHCGKRQNVSGHFMDDDKMTIIDQ